MRSNKARHCNLGQSISVESLSHHPLTHMQLGRTSLSPEEKELHARPISACIACIGCHPHRWQGSPSVGARAGVFTAVGFSSGFTWTRLRHHFLLDLSSLAADLWQQPRNYPVSHPGVPQPTTNPGVPLAANLQSPHRLV